MAGRRRQPNWTAREEEILMEEIGKRFSIIEGRVSKQGAGTGGVKTGSSDSRHGAVTVSKRTKRRNGSAQEQAVLMDEIKKHPSITEGRLSKQESGKCGIRRARHEAWQKIYAAFSSKCVNGERTLKLLKNKYSNKLMEEREASRGPRPLTAAEKMYLDMVERHNKTPTVPTPVGSATVRVIPAGSGVPGRQPLIVGNVRLRAQATGSIPLMASLPGVLGTLACANMRGDAAAQLELLRLNLRKEKLAFQVLELKKELLEGKIKLMDSQNNV